ncbi:stage VI sporulation protein D [Bacillus sp. FJAT-49732]|uniref:Stage VI sporulation protein D n=1 Tax=Lederbergia citrisecunda TaxID=2833583 RepID=A0A942TKK9_9BACI|nr:stage VI sporulation protein D [Lederbergia citrisecunda]MBS4199830.1 stage VI sporulation protein D [Lederbergia citrisecunda]
MPERQQTSLKFPLEETVWFQKGQEVDELISISLDPNISIFNEDDYVVLKGTLQLTGEFNHSIESDVVEDIPITGRTYIQAVDTRNEDESIFSHQFPVDITIPKRRIINVDEMEVEIHSFDYELEDSCRLKLFADIYVHGIYEDSLENHDSLQEDVEKEPIYESIELEEEIDEFPVVEEDGPVEIELLARSSKDEENQDENDQNDDDDYEELFEPFTVEARILPQEGEESGEKVHFQPSIPKIPELSLETLDERTLDFFPFKKKKVEPTEHYNEESPTEYYESSYESSSIESSPKKEEETVVKKKKDKYKSMSFADFFARKEEESHTKMRVRLVQHGDSIQQLAEKYDVSVQQILRANKLEASHEVYEGQVLYIPAKSHSSFHNKQ